MPDGAGATREAASTPSAPWSDGKRYLWLVALVMPMLPFVAMGMFVWTGWGVWLWLGPIVILGIVPVLDLVAGLDRSNPPDDVIAALEKDRYYRWLTFLFLPIQYAGFVTAFWFIATGDISVLDKVGLAVTVGFIAGLGINTAHELGHKRESHERWLAKIALAQSFYGHFYIEHNRGHHVRVATPADPASSRVGESFYAFWPRTVAGSLASAWRLERRRYGLRHQHPFRLGNDVINAWLMTVALWTVMILWLSAGILPYLVIQALIGLTLLEAVNYLEHYGMLRQIVGVPGKERYERVDPSHSWNSNNLATNVLLYHLQRHSDHHANPTRRYQALRDYKESPVLPTGYAGMILLALVPAAWRRTMDPRVLAHMDGDMGRANIAPRHRERVLARFGADSRGGGESASVAARQDASALTATVMASPGPGCTRCPGCGYVYDEAVGDPREGFPAGTPWSAVPEDWCCPDCGVRDKADFERIERTTA
jgi:alkane 1-monooxygenase